MPPPTLRSVLPRSLFGRALAILLVPIVLLQLVVGLVFFQRHYQRVTEQMTEAVAAELRHVVAEIAAAKTPAEAGARIAALAVPLGLDLTLDPGAEVAERVARDPFDATGATLANTLEAQLPGALAVDLTSDTRTAIIAVETVHGRLTAAVPRARLSVSNPHQLLVLMLTTAVLLSTIAVVFLRNQVRPIRRLAEAAEAFGKGRSVPFRPTGAEEVRRAGAAFLAMRGRIERQIDQRTRMLSGVSHDLRTPLTRMKLTLALMEDTAEMRDLEHDVDQMERMIAGFLDFSRAGQPELPRSVDPVALADAIAGDARRAGVEIERTTEVETPDAPHIVVRVHSIGRALENLIGNGARHGHRVRLGVRLLPRSVLFVVEDDGPGIPEVDRERAMHAFTRLDPARNQDAGAGVGLGLSIALDAARSHGGSLDLAESRDLGGLRATLRLPR